MIYAALFIMVIIGHQGYVYVTQGGIDWFSDFTWVDATFLILFVYGVFIAHPSIGETVGTEFASYVLFGMLATYFGLHGKSRRFFGRSSRHLALNVRLIRLLSAFYFFLVAFRIAFTLQRRGMSFFSYVSGGHLDYQKSAGYLGGSAWLERLSQPFWLPTLILFQYHLKRRQWGRALLIFLGLLVSVLFRQDRLGFIIVCGLLVFYYHRRVRSIRFYQILAAFFAVVFVSGAFNIWRSVGFSGMFQRASWPYAISRFDSDLNPVRWLYRLFQMNSLGRLEHDYFYQYVLTLIGQVPRVFWSSKPVTAFEPRYTEIVFNVKAGTGVPIRTFTVVGEGVAMLGFVGVLINCFVFGYIYRLARGIVGRDPRTFLAWYAFCFMFFPYFRGSTSALIAYALRSFIIILLLWRLIYVPVPDYVYANGTKMPRSLACDAGQ